MIDLQLLSKISAGDEAFVQSMIEKINGRAKDFKSSFADSMQRGNWSSCYYQMLDFYRSITPYGQMSFLNEFKKYLDILSHSDDSQVKKGICLTIINSINEHLGIAETSFEMPLQSTSTQKSFLAGL